MEHSGNEIITNFEDDVEPGVLNSSANRHHPMRTADCKKRIET